MSTCHTKVWLYNNQFWGGFSDWVHHMTRPIQCLFSTAARSITNILVKICSEDDAEHSENMTLGMENDDGEKCTTDQLQVSAGDSLISFRPGQFGDECSNFKVTSTTKVWASSPGNASLCLSHLILDNVEKESGLTRSQLCRFDQEEFYRVYNQESVSIPLICS